MNIEMLKKQLKFWALQALPEVERQAVLIIKNQGKKLLGPEKKKVAADFIKAKYAAVSARVPALAATTIDDDFVAAHVDDAIDWAWEQIGDLINELGRDEAPAPSVDNEELPKGGLVDDA